MPARRVLRTQRLVLTAPAPGDLPDMARLMADPDVMRWFDLCRPLSRGEVASQLDRWLAHQQAHGFAPGLIREPGSGRPIGHGGLARYPETEDQGPELIYLFDRACWGQGLATEFTRAVLAWGFRTLGLDRVLATARPENGASIRVLEKAGMRPIRWWPEVSRFLYGLSREASDSSGGT